MNISDFLRQLSFGELSNLSISNSGSGVIIEGKHPQLIMYMNTALTAVYSRFVLRQEEIIVTLETTITRYELLSKYTVSANDPTVTVHYITDTVANPFQDDLIRVLEVWDQYGKVPLNDADNTGSVFTPNPLVLYVPTPVNAEPLTLIYQAEHAQLLDTGAGYLNQEIVIPHYLHNAFRKRVAHEVYSHMSGVDNIMKGQEYLAGFEVDCLTVEQRDLASQSAHGSLAKFDERGFV